MNTEDGSLTINQSIIMEKLKAILGATITIILTIGVLFKIMHWPGAGIMIVLSASALSLYIFFAAGILQFKFMSFEDKLSIFSSRTKLAGTSASVLVIGLLFKIMHWPGAGSMLVIGFSSLIIVSILFLYSFFTKKEPIILTPTLVYITFSMCLLFLGYSSSGVAYRTLFKISDTAINIQDNINTINASNTSIINEKEHEKNSTIYSAAEDLNHYINKLKSKLYQNTDALTGEIADTISLSQIMAKDNYDIPTLILGLADPLNPKNGEYTATELKEKINAFNTVIKENSSTTKTINTVDYSFYNGKPEKWESSMFYHYTLAQEILTLNQIQLEANIICNTVLTSNLLQQTNNHQPDTIN